MIDHNFEMDSDGVHPVRPQPMYKMRVDKCRYDQSRPPCQVLPWLLSTPGVLFCVRSGDVPVQIVQSQLFEMLKNGIYINALVAGSEAAYPGTILWWKSSWSRGPMFELQINQWQADYKPVFVEPTWQSKMQAFPSCQWLNWRRERTVIWYDNRIQDHEF